MFVYHRTEHADAIQSEGFRDGYKIAVAPDEPAGILEFRGIWVSADAPLDENEGAHGAVVLVMEIPDELFAEYEWIDDEGTYRLAMIPAADLNAHAASLRRLSDEEVDTLTLARWERWQRSFPERSQDAEGQG